MTRKRRKFDIAAIYAKRRSRAVNEDAERQAVLERRSLHDDGRPMVEAEIAPPAEPAATS